MESTLTVPALMLTAPVNVFGLEIVSEYSDRISGAKAKRPGLERLMHDARRRRFDIVLVWAFDRMARSVRQRQPNQLGHRLMRAG